MRHVQKSYHYIPMLKTFLRKATASLPSKDTKDLGTSVSAIANEKLKQEKEATAGKKKTGKQSLSPNGRSGELRYAFVTDLLAAPQRGVALRRC